MRLKEAARYSAASEQAARAMASAAADREYQRQFASRSLAPVHPMLRNVAVEQVQRRGAVCVRVCMRVSVHVDVWAGDMRQPIV